MDIAHVPPSARCKRTITLDAGLGDTVVLRLDSLRVRLDQDVCRDNPQASILRLLDAAIYCRVNTGRLFRSYHYERARDQSMA
jgi:hypothetical protein